MTKFSVIKFIVKQRIPNILLLSIMFSSLIVVLMVGLGVKHVFYDYLKSDYGNIPDVKIVLNDISDEKADKLVGDLKNKLDDEKLNILTGYENSYKVSVSDSNDLLLTNGLELFIKGMRFSNRLNLLIDNQQVSLDVIDISYQDELFVKLDLKELKVNDKENIFFLYKNNKIATDFCKKTSIEDNVLTFEAVACKTKVDTFLEKLDIDKPESLKVEVDGKVFSTKLIYVDSYYKSLVVDPAGLTDVKNVSMAYGNIELDNSLVQRSEITDGELVIDFYQDNTLAKKYKKFLANILKDFIDYKRMILKIKIHSFENDDADDKVDPELVYLDELTDLIDIIFAKEMGNLAVSSSFLAGDLNNFGVLDNFNIKSGENEFSLNIRSTIEYNPEKIYDKNILIVNQRLLEENLQVNNRNNYIDIYLDSYGSKQDIKELNEIVSQYDSHFKILVQDEIIPSIAPKKILFDTAIIIIAVFILSILFIAMYIVLRQFYSNFNSELSLLKLYGSKIPYQAFINSVSFVISAVINYLFLLKQEEAINQIMLKYFFTEFQISIGDYLISLGVLFVYIVIMFFLEHKEIKKLNLIKGQ